MKSLAVVSMFLASALSASAEGCRRDRTGLNWVLPFTEARKKAAAENRLLMIKPIAFGTSADGGW
ncbi:MAG: hypothetical protein FD180_3541 [Planctomycetota bacterium]|nr:MAG: hypothetical protein FD180_3541 [Planctomycetota bacterium]